jgi:predicted transcriptional regulator
MTEEKKVRLLIGNREDLDKDIQRFFDNPSLIDEEPEAVFFFTSEQFSQLFTKNRVETLKEIGDMKPKTMGELVKSLNRPKESVSRDVKILSKAGLIEIETHGIYRTPKVVSRTISVAF